MNYVRKWLIVTRLETTLLALASVGLGSASAAYAGRFDWGVAVLVALTAVLLQVVCNMANDWGDWVRGADPINNVKPPSAIQTGLVTPLAIEKVLWPLVIITGMCGMLLLYVAELPPRSTGVFMALGAFAIFAAIAYTMGDRPYGYYGWGDLAVFVFFGPVGVGGSFYLHAQQFHPVWLLPALFHGTLAVAVLNVNNIRDMEFDAQVAKKTIPIRIGKKAAIRYHWSLLAISICAMIAFGWCYVSPPWLYAQGLVSLCLVLHGIAVSRKGPAQLTHQLQILVLIIFVAACLWIMGLTRQ